MPGLIQEGQDSMPQGEEVPQEPTQDGMQEGPSEADLINQLRQAAESKVQGGMKDSMQRVVIAGKKIMYSDESHDLLKQALDSDEDKMVAAGKGIAQLMAILMSESRNSIPEQVQGPAAISLLAEALDYIAQTTDKPISKEDVDRATQTFAQVAMKQSGMTPDLMKNMIGKSQELMSDPQHGQTIRKQLGSDPNIAALFGD